MVFKPYFLFERIGLFVKNKCYSLISTNKLLANLAHFLYIITHFIQETLLLQYLHKYQVKQYTKEKDTVPQPEYINP